MAKKKDKTAKKARTAEKAQKAQAKSALKQKKKASKVGEDDDDQDIDEILEQYAREQASLMAVKTAQVSRPSKRLSATLVASPSQHSRKELFLFGGESVNNVGLAEFYNDLYVYNVDTNIWRQITSNNSPLPRSGHAMCVHPHTGVILLFGGEFSSPKQNTFYHYGDTWLLDASTREWSKIETKKGPSARSGHRMTYWKNYIILFGGFRDLSASTTYLGDLWAFDVTTYKWIQIEFPSSAMKPEGRSGHSLIPTEDGAVLWGGYSKVKNSQKKIVGKVHTDTWNLRLTPDLKAVRWERRRKSAWAPSSRVGCSMVFHKGRGILFGGVYDTDETEETLDSEFFNDLYAYQVNSNKWFPLKIRPPRKKLIEQEKGQKIMETNELEENLNRLLNGGDAKISAHDDSDDEIDKKLAEDEEEAVDKVEHTVVHTMPYPRFNAAVAVQQDALYIYGGMWELKDKEFNLDSMYGIDLGKLDGVKVIWEDFKEDIERAAEVEESSDDDDDDDGDDNDDDDEDESEAGDDNDEEVDIYAKSDEKEDILAQDVLDDAEPLSDLASSLNLQDDPRPFLPHPRPFESLRAFYSRTSGVFMEWAISDNKDDTKRAKDLKRDAFKLCEERWWERIEQVRALEDQYEESGVGEIVDLSTKNAGTSAGKSRR
ncbi:hypothetical protein V1511DRAFT_495775 [Dipodascopsis uninucleata]